MKERKEGKEKTKVPDQVEGTGECLDVHRLRVGDAVEIRGRKTRINNEEGGSPEG